MAHPDEYSFFFKIHYDDGQIIETSFDDCEIDESHAIQEISHQYSEAEEIEYLGYERNY